MKHSLTSLAAQQAALTAENRALREEIAKLRERIAVLEHKPRPPGGVQIDWAKPLMIGSPRFVAGTIPPGTITC